MYGRRRRSHRLHLRRSVGLTRLFEIEREIYRLSAEQRLQVHQERGTPLLGDLEVLRTFERSLRQTPIPEIP
jgi:hypothetical protein